MSSPEPIPPPNDRRSSRASSADMVMDASGLLPVGGPPNSPSPLQIRAAHSSHTKKRRSSASKRVPDLHLIEYVTQPDSNLVCLICHSPFDRPVQIVCGHFFCRECLHHAWRTQPSGRKTCPTCRSKTDPEKDLRRAPKIVETMLDELLVKCPNTKSGCGWVEQRGNVHDHITLYCEYTLVDCAEDDCELQISQKDYHLGCLHYTVNCADCQTSLMKKDLEDHRRTTCANRSTNCPHCDIKLVRLDLNAHMNDACTKVITPCQGMIVGCSFTAERGQTNVHEKSCPMATMAPHFRDQQARIEHTEARLEPLTRKVGILEDGLSNITNMLYPANDSSSTFPVTNPLDPNISYTFPPTNLIPTPDFRLPPASFPPVAPTESQPPFTTNPSQPPFDSQVHHLLTLHESLRDEVNRVTNALTELEGRTNMMVINESQRTKDEMLHTNAAINSMRMQLHWLMSATLQQRNSARTSAANAGAAAAAGSASGAGAQGPSTARPGGPSAFHSPLRRLSDSTRQDTKL